MIYSRCFKAKSHISSVSSDVPIDGQYVVSQLYKDNEKDSAIDPSKVAVS